MADCPATREAVEEMEECGELGCPLCGRGSEAHAPEGDPDQADEEFFRSTQMFSDL